MLFPSPVSEPSSRLVLVGRLLLLSAAAAAAIVALRIATTPAPTATLASTAPYACPMHPNVTSVTPGTCSICGMALQLVAPTGAPAPAASSRHLDNPSVDPSVDPSIVTTVRPRTLTRDLRAPAWVDDHGDIVALLPLDEIDAPPSPTPPAHFVPATAHGSPIPVQRRRSDQDPAPLPWDDATAQVRFHPTDDPAGRVAPGDTGWLVQEARPRTQLVVPYGAVLHAASGPYVLRARATGQGFEPQPVTIGSVVNDLAIVVTGLRAGDRVALRDAFFLDADQRARTAGAEPPR
jgi:hypothetical protein